MRPGTKEPIGAGLPSLRPTFKYKYCVCLKRYCSKYSRRLSKTLRVAWLKVIIAISATLPSSPNTQHHGKEGDEGSSWSPQEGNEGDEGKEGMKVSWVVDCFNSGPLVFSHALAFWWPVHWKQVTWLARIELLKVKCACGTIVLYNLRVIRPGIQPPWSRSNFTWWASFQIILILCQVLSKNRK